MYPLGWNPDIYGMAYTQDELGSGQFEPKSQFGFDYIRVGPSWYHVFNKDLN